MTAAAILDTLGEAATRALVVAAVVALALTLFRVKTPGIRHAAWTGALVVMLLLPVVSGWMPTVPVPGWVPVVSTQTARVPTVPADRSTSQVTESARPVSAPGVSVGVASTTTRSMTAPAGAWVGAEPPVTTARTWREWALVAWLLGGLFLITRELAGGWAARRLARSGVPVPGERHVYSSPHIVSPVVVGVLAPRVMVPSSWPRWGGTVRDMVLLHERAHVARRDPLVACLARLNRAVFWFHPLAWWLERHLKAVSERACDDVVVRAGREPRLYAAMLVEMARRLRRNGRRVAWQGMGIVHPRRFEDRVDHVLAGPAPQTSRLRTAGLAGVCALLIGVGVACGAPVPPLAEDPDLAQAIRRQAERSADYEAAQSLTLEQAADLERAVAANPDDLRATEKLIIFYSQRGQKLMGWHEMLAARRPHILRMIARHPTSGLVRWPYARPLDPEGYDQARALWLGHVERADASPQLLSQAAWFFERSEKPMAEQLLLRAKALDPDGPSPRVTVSGVYQMPWARRLGTLYAMAIVGADGTESYDSVTTINRDGLSSVFATHARRMLDETTDPAMLTGASYFLTRQAANARVDFDPKALGLAYADRLLKVDPTSQAARQILGGPAHDAYYRRMLEQLGKPAALLDEAAFDRLPDTLKLAYAHQHLWQPYNRAMAAYQKQDEVSVTRALDDFKRRAEVIERLTSAAPASGTTAAILADVQIAFGTYAMRQGDRREAVRRLKMATTWPALATPSAGSPSGISAGGTGLAHDLLAAGERESVAEYYDAVSKTAEPWQRRVAEDAAAAIRAGRMPREYQRYRAGLR